MTPTPTIFTQLHWKRPWCWERWRARGEEGHRGWDGWMPITERTWVWASSGRRRRTGKPGVRQPAGSQSRTRLSDWASWNYNHVKTCIINCSKNNKSTEKKVPSERGGLFHNLNLHLLNFPECSHFKAPLGDAVRMLMGRANSFIANGKLLFFIFW